MARQRIHEVLRMLLDIVPNNIRRPTNLLHQRLLAGRTFIVETNATQVLVSAGKLQYKRGVAHRASGRKLCVPSTTRDVARACRTDRNGGSERWTDS